MELRGKGVQAEGKSRISADEGTDDLVFFIVVRFIVMMLLVMGAESLMVWFESVTLLPGLQKALQASQGLSLQSTTSLVSLLRWMVLLVVSVFRGDFLQMVGLARGSLALLLLLIMLVLLALPIILGAMGFSRGVVRRVRLLQERREQELAEADRQRSRFMTDIAHDLRTPIMAISGMAHAISDGVVRDDAMRDEYVRSIGDKADKLGSLVSSVFDYTKLGSGAFVLERETIDLPQLLLREAATAYTDIEEASMCLSVEVPEDSCLIEADSTQLARVVANLLTNAVKHNDAGTEIALLMVRRAGVAYVIVADTGDPIAGNPNDLFQPFSRGDKARSDAGGSGLGLSICKRIAELHEYDLQLVQPYGRFAKAFVLTCAVVG